MHQSRKENSLSSHPSNKQLEKDRKVPRLPTKVPKHVEPDYSFSSLGCCPNNQFLAAKQAPIEIPQNHHDPQWETPKRIPSQGTKPSASKKFGSHSKSVPWSSFEDAVGRSIERIQAFSWEGNHTLQRWSWRFLGKITDQ